MYSDNQYENYEDILGYCSYCRDGIKQGEPFVVEGGEKYHTWCYEQMGRYYDPYEHCGEGE